MLTSTLLYGGLIPAVAAAATMLLVARLRTPATTQWASGVTAGVLAGLLALKSRAGFAIAIQSLVHPSDAADWVPLIILVAWAAAMLRIAGDPFSAPSSIEPTVAPTNRLVANVPSLLFIIAVPVCLLSGNIRLMQEWSAFHKLAWLAILAVALGVVWRALATDDQRPSVVKLPLIAVTAIVAAIVLTFSAHVFVYGEACVTLAAALSGAALARLLPLPLAAPPSLPLLSGEGRGEGCGASGSASANRAHWTNGLSGAAAPITFTLGSYLILGHFFADLSTLNAALLAVSLVAAGGPLPRQLVDRPIWQQITLRSMACLLPLVTVALSALE